MSKLAVALDVSDRDACLEWVKLLRGYPIVLKLGLGLLPLLTPDDIMFIRSEGFEIFADAKLHDIPSQVARAVNAWVFLGVRYLTLHLSGGEAMIKAAVDAAAETSLHLLGVTVLTSLSENDLESLGQKTPVSSQVERLMKLGLDCGIRGFVSSVGEIAPMKEMARQKNIEPLFVTPGLVAAHGQGHQDQSRVYTFEEAAKMGAGLLVVGRSIIENADPRFEVERILKMIRDHA